MHAQQVLSLVVVEFEFALMGMVQRLPQVAREMNVGGGHQHAIRRILDSDDAGERVLAFFLLLVVAQQFDEFIAMGGKVRASDLDEAGGEMILDTQSGRTGRFLRA